MSNLKIEIVPSDCRLPLKEGWTRLTDDNFNHYESFFAKHLDIHPESADLIHVKYVLECQEYPLIIIRHLDWMLKKGGKLIIDMCTDQFWAGGIFKPYNLICSIISRSFDDRLDQIVNTKEGKCIHLEYIKKRNSNPIDDTMEKWTFAICSNGSQNERVLSQIRQIIEFDIPQYEILVCGPSPAKELPKNVYVIDDSSIYSDTEKRYPIGKKKNLIIKKAKYNNLFLIHDRFIFVSDWYQRMKKYGNYFDILMPSMLSVEYEGMRAGGDWKLADLNIYGVMPDDRNIPYQKYDYRICINGGLILGKLDKIKRVPMEDSYYWDEAEDVIWSAQLTNRNYLLQVDTHNEILTYTYSSGISPNTNSTLYRLRRKRFYYERQLNLEKMRSSLIGNEICRFNRYCFFYSYYKIACFVVKHFIKE